MDNSVDKVNAILREYRDKLFQYRKLVAEIGAEKETLKELRNNILIDIKACGFSNKTDIINKCNELKKQQVADVNMLRYKRDEILIECARITGEKDAYIGMLNSKKDAHAALLSTLLLNTEVSIFLMAVSEKIRTQTCEKIEDIVTKGLAHIFNFNPPLKFKIEMAVKSGTWHADFKLEDTRTKNISTVLDSFGGGVGDVIGTILRLCLLEFQIPKNTAPVFLDECGKFISGDRQERFADFLHEWSETFNRQIILISHRPEVITHADKIIKISYSNGISIVS